MKIAKQLTEKQIAAIKSGCKAVGGAPGLYLQVRGGSKLWIFRYTNPATSKVTHYSLGAYKSLSISDARTEARRLSALVKEGKNPSQERDIKKAEQIATLKARTLFKDLAEEWISIREKNGYYDNDPRGSYRCRVRLSKYLLPSLGSIPVADITPDHLLPIFQPLYKAHTSTLNKIKAITTGIFNYAMAKRIIKASPADFRGALGALLSATGKPQIKTHHHGALYPSEMPEFIKDLRLYNSNSSLAFEFAVLTASRSQNVRLMRWGEVDLNARRWIIPAEKMKIKNDAHIVMLSDRAIEILKKIGAGRPDEYVFTNERTGTHFSDMFTTAVIKGINERRVALGQSEWIDQAQTEKEGKPVRITQHGVSRASFKTWTKQPEQWRRFNVDAVELCLHHTIDKKYLGAYDRETMESDRLEIMQAWADYLYEK